MKIKNWVITYNWNDPLLPKRFLGIGLNWTRGNFELSLGFGWSPFSILVYNSKTTYYFKKKKSKKRK